MKINKKLILFLLILNISILEVKLERFAVASNYMIKNKLHKQKPVHKENTAVNIHNPNHLTKDDLPDMSIYFQGWVKYFRYNQANEKPKMFFKTNYRRKQRG